MLTKRQLELLWHINGSCIRCIKAAKYFDVVSGKGSNLWKFTQNCYGGICVIYWCQVFGSQSEPTHYSHLYDNGAIASISKDDVKAKLRESTGKTLDEYTELWKSVKNARDKFLVHYDFNTSDNPEFPDLKLLVKICLEMRNIILKIITSEKSVDINYQMNFKHHFSKYTNERLVFEIDKESHRLENAVKCKQTTKQGTGVNS